MFAFFYKKRQFFIFALVAIVLILSALTMLQNMELSDIGEGATIEMFGLLFGVLLFGVLLEFFNESREKKLTIQRYQEELDDYRGWKEKEASYRIFGLIVIFIMVGTRCIPMIAYIFWDNSKEIM